MYWQGSVHNSGQTPNRNSPILQANANSTNNFPPQQLMSMSNVGDGNSSAPPTPMNISPPQQMQNQPVTIPTSSVAQNQQPSKELHAAALCRFGQETVQEIVGRTQEIFTTLRATQPPDGKSAPGVDRKSKVPDAIKIIRTLFKRLRAIYDRIEDASPTNEDVDIELERAIPFKNQPSVLDDRKNTEVYLATQEEYRELMEQVILKNRYLRDTMDQLRFIIWDVNTMLAMRKE